MRQDRLSYVETLEAEERGRAMAERMVASNPDAKARVEAKFGVAYCQRRYPLAYQEERSEARDASTSLEA